MEDSEISAVHANFSLNKMNSLSITNFSSKKKKEKKEKKELFKQYKLFFKIKTKKNKTNVTIRWRYYKKDITNMNNCRGFPLKKGVNTDFVLKKRCFVLFF